MASDLNTVGIVGRATRDAELHGGLLAVRLAFTTRTRGQGSDEWTDKPNYVDVVVAGKRAASLEQYITKGARIGVTGHLEWREWTTGDGERRQTLQIFATDVQLLGGTEQRAQASQAQPEPRPQSQPIDDDDIPF